MSASAASISNALRRWVGPDAWLELPSDDAERAVAIVHDERRVLVAVYRAYVRLVVRVPPIAGDPVALATRLLELNMIEHGAWFARSGEDVVLISELSRADLTTRRMNARIRELVARTKQHELGLAAHLAHG